MTWLDALRQEWERVGSQRKVAATLGYSPTVVSQVLSGTYKGDLTRVQAVVEGALMGLTVECPVVGDLARHRCLAYQGQEFASTNPMRVRLYRACRDGCPHSRIGGES